MPSPIHRPLTISAESPQSTPSHKHNTPKHPHKVHGEKRAKHQPKPEGAPHTKHLLPTPKGVLNIIGSIKPPSVLKPKMEVTLPSREAAADFVTYSPFDSSFPAIGAQGKTMVNAKSDKAVSAAHHRHNKVAHRNHAANDHAHHANNRHFKQMPTEKAHKQKHHRVAAVQKPISRAVAPTTPKASRRMLKEHAHHVPRQVANKKPWHLAGWVTYSPFDSEFDRVCGAGSPVTGSPARQRKHKRPHHVAGQPHHPGHHQAHHAKKEMQPATKAIANFYATAGLAAFPRMSPTAISPPVTSFFMPAPRTAAPSTMAGLPGSMRAFAPNAPAFSSGFAW